jgi:hypothetical protein
MVDMMISLLSLSQQPNTNANKKRVKKRKKRVHTRSTDSFLISSRLMPPLLDMV